MRPLRAAATALVAVLALSSCDGGSDPADPSPTAQPSASSSEPSPTPPTEKPVEPVLPAAATKATEAGARAFITYYWDLINYAQVTGDVKPLKGVSGPNCAGCNAGINSVKKLYEDGGHLEGGEYAVNITKINKIKSRDSSNHAFEAQLSTRNKEQIRVNGDGSEEVSKPGSATVVVAVLWSTGSWRLEIMEVR